MLLLFALTLFVGAALLFMVEPMFAKMVLPLLGGTPSVWNTCIVFFQAALLAGYFYAHAASSRLGVRRGIPLHLCLLLLPLLSLPIGISAGWHPPRAASPVPWLLLLLLVSVGLPFFVVSTGGPLIQKWFACTGHPSARDPYFLYAASNAGSVLGLIGYLVVLEPFFTLAQQSRIWTAGYVAFIALTAACALSVFRRQAVAVGTAEPAAAASERWDVEAGSAEVTLTPETPVSAIRRLRWTALAFVPASLLLGSTTYITTDIASVPLLWVVPLLLYLVSFILTFARRPPLPHGLFLRLLPMLVLVQTVVLAQTMLAMPWMPLLHLATFFTAAMACHGELARDRPPPQHLTEFYLILSIGGALGGMFNALLAPLLFRSVAEYPIVLVLACVLCLGRHGARRAARRTAGCWSPAPLFNLLDVLWPAALGILAVGLIYADHTTRLGALPRSMSFLLGALAFLCFTLSGRPLRFGLGLACLLVIIGIDPGTNARHLLQERSFFGVLRVVYDADGDQTELLHGTTEHGAQSRDPARRREPLTYYFSTGPIGQVFAAFGGPAAFKDVALVGLGAGTLACYAEPGQRFTFYEIDPAVRRIALNPSYFTYLPDARQRGADLRIRLGDARLSLSEGPAGEYDLIILDAFGSDSIATHLLTRQALQVYLRRLAPRGIIAFHVSNRYLNLWPVIGDLASDAGLACLGQEDRDVSDADWRLGKRPSEWMLLARRDTDFGILRQNQRWQRVRPRRRARPWTDDYSNILSVLAF